MLPRLIIFILALFLFVGCDWRLQKAAKEQKNRMAIEVSIGDGIYAVKEKLETAGFRIKYSPDFPTKTETYLLMIVDFGLRPTEGEVVRQNGARV